ncbi:hypothetical protein ACE6H2_027026 [Prunus campanulata]
MLQQLWRYPKRQTAVNIVEHTAPRELPLRSTSKSLWAVEESTTVNEGHRSSREWPKIVKRAFLASCVFGVLIDPLFFYIPFVNKNTKCIGLDNS